MLEKAMSVAKEMHRKKERGLKSEETIDLIGCLNW